MSAGQPLHCGCGGAGWRSAAEWGRPSGGSERTGSQAETDPAGRCAPRCLPGSPSGTGAPTADWPGLSLSSRSGEKGKALVENR